MGGPREMDLGECHGHWAGAGSRAASALDNLLKGVAETAALPLEQARGLPPAVYRDEALAALEQERIFRRDWSCAGLAAEIPGPGDYLTFSLAGEPILCLRGEDGEVRSFANLCRHRLMRLVEGRGSCRRLVCPYHAWSYDLEGRLIGAGHMGKKFEKSGIRLAEVRTEIWQGWIYLTLDPETPPLAELLAPLECVVARYAMADYLPIVTEDHVWRTNWKLLCENFMEGYHLPVVHRETVGAWFPVEETRFPEETFEAFTYQTFAKSEGATYGRAPAENTRLEGAWRGTSVLPTVFPAHMYVLAPDHLWYLSLRPQGVGEVAVRFGVALAPEVEASLGEARETWLSELLQFFDKVNAEDRAIVEGIFGSTASSFATPGPLSWLEREIHDFQGFLARRLCE
ncbi:MAG: SRPBCC family protein [Acidobacteriota bacterium]